MHRYVAIKDCSYKIDDDYVQDLLLNNHDDQDMECFLRLLTDLDSVTKSLQDSNVSLADARVLFNDEIEKHPETEARLGVSSNIVEYSAFESAI